MKASQTNSLSHLKYYELIFRKAQKVHNFHKNFSNSIPKHATTQQHYKTVANCSPPLTSVFTVRLNKLASAHISHAMCDRKTLPRYNLLICFLLTSGLMRTCGPLKHAMFYAVMNQCVHCFITATGFVIDHSDNLGNLSSK